MTEAEWLVHDYPVALLHSLDVAPHHYKVLHYVVALADLHPEWRTGQVERWLDALKSVLNNERSASFLDSFRESLESEFVALAELERAPESRAFDSELCNVALGVWRRDGWWYGDEVIQFDVLPAILGSMRRKTTALLRDIFGNPFRPVAFSPEWRTDTAIALARTMYDQREFSAMPILADALQDAGCDNPDILTHCRDTSLTHVRGCWVTDLVLGKE